MRLCFLELNSPGRPDDNGLGRGSRPVFGISSYEAIAFCNWLSEKEGLIPCYTGRKKATRCDFSANGYRLPTEAEWEYAARGGPLSRGCQYAGSDDPDEVAWYDENSGGELHPVGQKKPNELGLYDMSGNMWDWCWDWYDSDYYNSSPEADPGGLTSLRSRFTSRIRTAHGAAAVGTKTRTRYV
ncbi:MAG TPA: formylglycine-generating enzyme family protein [Chloroflexi bacterium]|nr:formylglycine-generating enzyme family protein [Chloroflexota bacterium]